MERKDKLNNNLIEDNNKFNATFISGMRRIFRDNLGFNNNNIVNCIMNLQDLIHDLENLDDSLKFKHTQEISDFYELLHTFVDFNAKDIVIRERLCTRQDLENQISKFYKKYFKNKKLRNY